VYLGVGSGSTSLGGCYVFLPVAVGVAPALPVAVTGAVPVAVICSCYCGCYCDCLLPLWLCSS